mgnify:CR=1 FL=1
MESPPEGRDSGSGQQMSAVDFARAAAQLACDSHCEDVRLLDLRGLSHPHIHLGHRPFVVEELVRLAPLVIVGHRLLAPPLLAAVFDGAASLVAG